MSTKTLIRGADFGDTYVIGVDPGPVPGVVGLLIRDREVINIDTVQCCAGALSRVLLGLRPDVGVTTWVACEAFVNGPRSGRLRTPGGGRAAREVAGEVARWAHGFHLRYIEHPAGTVKPWATDKRLGAVVVRSGVTGARVNASGLLDATTGMRHARDAGRVSVYAAVEAGLMNDPLSRKGAR